MTRLYRPLTLKLHAFGLTRLHDPNWTGMELYDRFKRYYRGREEPRDLFQKPIREGFLFQLGSWLYEQYLLHERHREDLQGEYLVWYCEELLEFLAVHELSHEEDDFKGLESNLSSISGLFNGDEDAYFGLVESYRGRRLLLERVRSITEARAAELMSLAPEYASNYAERVFHDRELCGFISTLLVEIGFDGTGADEDPVQWVDRVSIPAWAMRALVARERGSCALCSASITQELTAKPNIDHIVPIARGGCNDIVNLQLLCEQCNSDKSDHSVPVRNSIPAYLQRRTDRD